MSQRLPSLPSNRAFVGQFRLPPEDSPMLREGRVEYVISGQMQRFQLQKQLWTFITHVLTALQSRCLPGAATAISAVGDTLKPCVDALRSKLNALGTA